MHKVRAAGLEDKIEADSAGTGDWHVGKPPHHGTRAMLARNGIEYAHKARLITTDDLDTFDYVLTMDNANLRDVRALGRGRPSSARFWITRRTASSRGSRSVLDGGFEGVYAPGE